MPRLATTVAFGMDLDLPRLMDWYARLGCTHAQLFRRGNVDVGADEALGVVRDAGLTYDSIHGRYGEAADPSNPDPAARSEAVRVFEREGEVAMALAGAAVVVHPADKIREAEATDEPPAERVEALLRSMDDLASVGEELGIVYLFENLPGNHWIGFDARRLAEWIRRVESHNVRMCFDTGHAHIQAARHGAVADQLADCLDVVAYVHVHDNDGTADRHLIPGRGTIDWERMSPLLARLGDDVSCMLELFDGPEAFEDVDVEGLRARLSAWLATNP